MSTILQQNEFFFKPRARIIKTIGEDLISNDNTAVLELVKNSYDANSEIVVITFEGKLTEKIEGNKKKNVIVKENSSLVIFDQGCGMDFSTIENAWMEPATNFKKINSNHKRKFVGEKGIGRFAVAKLANRLELVTRKENQNEIVVTFDWDQFSAEDAYLDNIKIKWQIRKPEEIKKSGTILKLQGLKNDWDEEKIRNLRVSLSRLLNPIGPSENFLIELNLPKDMDQSLAGIIEKPGTLDRPDYYIKGNIDTNGQPQKVVYFSRSIGKEEDLPFKKDIFFLKNPARKSIAGPFSFEFRIWNRDDLGSLAKEVNSTVRNVKKDLDDLCGISIYRDNVRVLPYGNKNNDWARLDLRRVNNPTLRLSNNQIVGFLSIGLKQNPLLTDQSNREGIIEGQAFDDLKEFVKLILNEAEQRRYKERPREEAALGLKKEGMFQKFSLKDLSLIIEENTTNKKILDAVKQKEKEIKEGLGKIQEVIARYRRLTTLGNLIDSIVHDGRGYLNKIDIQANLLLKVLDRKEAGENKCIGYAESIQKIRKDFAQLFRRVEPFGGRKRGRPQVFIIEDLIKDQFLFYKSDLERLKISYTVSETQHKVSIDEAELGIIFMNLIQNSIYWLEEVQSERKITVQLFKETDGLSIIFSDSGPGIKEGTESQIFEPYFSTKPDGIGLGLAIVGELVTEYNGELLLLNHGPLAGATFKINLKYRV